MSKHQSTIKAYFHKHGESKKRPGSTDITDDEHYSNTENKSPNNVMSAVISCDEENQSQTKNKKLKIQDTKEVDEKSTCQSSLKTEKLEKNVSNEKYFLSLCDKFNGALKENIGISWFENLENEFEKPYFQKLNEFLQQERKNYTVFPPHDEVWSWTQHFCVTDTRVVIIGQDPYHGPMQAHGLCFSVKHGVKPPPSLINMYKELERDNEVKFNRPTHGFLEGWSKQGVLLLNAVLTVRSGQANSHKDRGWEKITDAVIKIVSEKCEKPVVFLLWGAYAQKKAASVDKRHHLLKSVHPSPLSAHRGFIGCNHFSECNKILVKEGREPIDWSKL